MFFLLLQMSKFVNSCKILFNHFKKKSKTRWFNELCNVSNCLSCITLFRKYGWPPRFGVGKGKAAKVDFAPSAVYWVGEEMPCVRYDQQTTASVLVHRVADITLNGVEGLAVSKDSTDFEINKIQNA
jgi:hypothetical protein